MKNFTKNTIATLALIAFTQTLSANYAVKNFETLDVTKFSSVWQELNKNDKENKAHLSTSLSNLLDNSITIAYEECTPSLDVTKFSSLWQEVNTNNNNAMHLTSALDNTLNQTLCTIS